MSTKPADGPRRTDRPLDEAGVVTAVRRAAERGARIRPTGAAGRPPGPLARTDDQVVDASALTGVAAVTDDRVVVRAGEAIADLCVELAAAGRALAAVPDAARATVGGAVGLGMYGGAPREGSLSAQVVAARLVDGRGTVRQVAGPELDAVRCGLGALGVLTALELRTVPLARLAVHERATRLDDVLAEDVLAAHAWTEMDVLPSGGQTVVRWADPVDPDREPTPAAPFTTRAAGRAEEWGRKVTRLASTAWSSWPPPDRWTPGTEGPPHEVLPDPQPWDPDTAEWAVPRAALAGALRELGAAATARGWDLRPVRVRLGAAETGWLHPAHERDTAWIRVRTRGAAQEPLRRLAGAVLEDSSGRPHWTSRHEWRPDDLAVAYRHWPDFQRVRDTYDPDRRFTDENLARVLGP